MIDPNRSFAGACTEGGPKHYIQMLERIAAGKKTDSLESPFTCLDLHLGMTNRWAGPRAAKKIARYRKSLLRGRLKRACAKIIRRGKYWPAKECVQLLAAYGIRTVGERDTFLLQQKYFPYGLDTVHLATLGDPRVVPQLIERFSEEQSCFEVQGERGEHIKECSDFKKRTRNKWKRKRYQEHKIAVLNALWHLADPTSRGFLEKLVKNDPDQLIRERVRKVLLRLPQDVEEPKNKQ